MYCPQCQRVLHELCVRCAAVSYTHLRAHETVLDLVCRLLLEKKKHMTILSNISRDLDKHIIQIYSAQDIEIQYTTINN